MSNLEIVESPAEESTNRTLNLVDIETGSDKVKGFIGQKALPSSVISKIDVSNLSNESSSSVVTIVDRQAKDEPGALDQVMNWTSNIISENKALSTGIALATVPTALFLTRGKILNAGKPPIGSMSLVGRMRYNSVMGNRGSSFVRQTEDYLDGVKARFNVNQGKDPVASWLNRAGDDLIPLHSRASVANVRSMTSPSFSDYSRNSVDLLLGRPGIVTRDVTLPAKFIDKGWSPKALSNQLHIDQNYLSKLASKQIAM